MEISPLLLTELLLFSFLFGGIVGAFNDINRIIRVFFGVRYTSLDFSGLYAHLKLSKPLDDSDNSDTLKIKKSKDIFLCVLIFIQDLLLVLFATGGIILLNYYYNDGKFRFFALLAMLLGFVLYYFTIGKLLMFISEPIMLILRTVAILLIRIMLAPFRFILKSLKKIFKKIYIHTKKHIEKHINIRYNRREVKRLFDLSKIGFLM